jgi:ADP-ribose pyrophosphatase YjhB (NUDIX family)
MSDSKAPRWLEWAREIQALSQIGLYFSQNEHEEANYRRLQEIATEMIAQNTGMSESGLEQIFCAQPGYATAKIDVRGAVVRDGRILLVRERIDGLWCMPGGWADVGEMPSNMVKREVLEESGVEVRPTRIVGVFDANREGGHLELFHAYKVVFLCELLSGEPAPGTETLDAAFHDPEDPPALSPNRTNSRHLREVLAHLRDPGRQASFD